MNKNAWAALFAATVMAAGCGKSGPQVPSASERGPVVAKVNGVEIFQGQVSAVLSRFGNIPSDKLPMAEKQVLEKLVEERLILQLAQEKKLDQDPKVLEALNAARNEILVKAYLEQAGGAAAQPTDAEIQAFYDKNPALFKERKIYNLRELSVPAKPELLPQLQEKASKAKSLEEVAEWLKGEKIGFAVSAAPKAAEQLPLELVPKFAALKPGDLLVVSTGSALLVEQLLASKEQPVDLATARSAIERLLTLQKRNEVASTTLKEQKQKAKIEYLADYAKPAKN